ncbi:MAG: acylphosphatase, partial [Thermodesulfobacteriota bacterium]|nr:acylphosphatase [Thermodesulfobacteriota bacterium]
MTSCLGKEEPLVCVRLTVSGIVQGVGFRPFVYQLALESGLRGEVANTSSGVTIHVEGTEDKIEAFTLDLRKKRPPLAHITEIAAGYEPIRGYTAFTIQN